MGPAEIQVSIQKLYIFTGEKEGFGNLNQPTSSSFLSNLKLRKPDPNTNASPQNNEEENTQEASWYNTVFRYPCVGIIFYARLPEGEAILLPQ